MHAVLQLSLTGIADAWHMVISGICDFVCVGLCVCVRVCSCSKRKTARAINSKLSTHVLYGSRSAYSVLEVKRSKVKVT